MSKAAKRPAAVPNGALVREVTVLNQFGIHARPAALFVKTASQFVSEIQVENNGVRVSAKSIMGLLTIEGYQGVVLRLIAVGPDAAAALDALAELVENKFFED